MLRLEENEILRRTRFPRLKSAEGVTAWPDYPASRRLRFSGRKPPGRPAFFAEPQAVQGDTQMTPVEHWEEEHRKLNHTIVDAITEFEQKTGGRVIRLERTSVGWELTTTFTAPTTVAEWKRRRPRKEEHTP